MGKKKQLLFSLVSHLRRARLVKHQGFLLTSKKLITVETLDDSLQYYHLYYVVLFFISFPQTYLYCAFSSEIMNHHHVIVIMSQFCSFVLLETEKLKYCNHICLILCCCVVSDQKPLQSLTYVLFRENFHPFPLNTYSILDHFQKLIKCLLRGIPTSSVAQQKFRQNKTLLSLFGAKIKDMKLQRGSKILLYLLPLCIN